jgi:hypothetical protein
MRTVALLYKSQTGLNQAFIESDGLSFAGLPMLCTDGGTANALLSNRVVMFETRMPKDGVRQSISDPKKRVKDKTEVNLGRESVSRVLRDEGWKGLKKLEVPEAGSLQKPRRKSETPAPSDSRVAA